MSTQNQQIRQPREGQLFFRFVMVISSMTPLFLLLAIRGVPLIDSKPIISQNNYMSACILLIIIPAIILFIRIYYSGKNKDEREIVIVSHTDHKDHLLAYLFATVIPLYQNNYNSVRDFYAEIGVIIFVLFLFTHMNLHYMNLIFAVIGFRVFTVETDNTNNGISGRRPFILLTQRHTLNHNEKLIVRRISDTIFIEL